MRRKFVGNVSGYDNLMELAKIRKIAGKEEIMALCERFGLAEHIHKKYGKLLIGHETKDASDPGFHGETGYPDPGRAI